MPTAPIAPAVAEAPREAWFQRLRKGLARTGTGIAQVFTGTRIDDTLYEELESALLMADTGVRATEHLLKDLKQRVKVAGATEPSQVKALLADAIVDLLAPLERSLMVGEHQPTVIMVAGVNGAGKTTSIGKLTRHLADANCKVLLAAADTFRAAAREQLEVWADRNQVEIVSQEGGDPASVTFDSVKAGKARGCDVVIADTAGRPPTQMHLMEELKKIKRVIAKAEGTAPHEVLLVVDGNTGQNALEQVKAFDAALGLTGLIVTKLDGTAKGGVLAAIALWSRDRATQTGAKAIPVYFIGVGEKLRGPADLRRARVRQRAAELSGATQRHSRSARSREAAKPSFRAQSRNPHRGQRLHRHGGSCDFAQDDPCERPGGAPSGLLLVRCAPFLHGLHRVLDVVGLIHARVLLEDLVVRRDHATRCGPTSAAWPASRRRP